MEGSWRRLFGQDERLRLHSGCAVSDLSAAEQRLGYRLPGELREVLVETDGVFDVRGQWYVGWPLARIVEDNVGFGRDGQSRLGPGLVAFGDDGTGNPFCLAVPALDSPRDSKVYWWGWIDLEAVELASSLRDFWEGWLRGEIQT